MELCFVRVWGATTKTETQPFYGFLARGAVTTLWQDKFQYAPRSPHAEAIARVQRKFDPGCGGELASSSALRSCDNGSFQLNGYHWHQLKARLRGACHCFHWLPAHISKAVS